MRLRQIIASSCRQNILVTLSKMGSTHITNLVRVINSTYNQVNRNLEILEEEKIVRVRRFGHMKMIELARENPRTQTLLKALNILDSPTQNTAGAMYSSTEHSMQDISSTQVKSQNVTFVN